ncbi:hypothetical protein K491DRAFT_676530 [Lophiostoma macrostomum CBS 122681]|uniref:SET domain-containing protein n=1 Tax=Lophiostoma macrostomum CBS 122681 TaxID=1314788 RepID=A0A6A6TG25_9PLEO|nr:hypothetical protein K491DRAFT_676530 [Lophiostoma macrostomum CBS 122681]
MAFTYIFIRPDKLHGLRAASDLQPGTLVAEPEPLLAVEVPCSHEDWEQSAELRKNFFEDQNRKGTKAPSATRSPNSPRTIYEYFAAFQGCRGNNAALVIFPTICNVRHSCRPNAVINYTDGRASLRAMNPIRKDEEITVDMLPGDLWLDTKRGRQEYLLNRFNYTCTCVDCNHDNQSDGEKARARLQRQHPKIKQICTSLLSSVAISAGRTGQGRQRLVETVWDYQENVLAMGFRDIRLAHAHIAVASITGPSYPQAALDHAVRAMIIIARTYGTDTHPCITVALELLRRYAPFS